MVANTSTRPSPGLLRDSRAPRMPARAASTSPANTGAGQLSELPPGEPSAVDRLSTRSAQPRIQSDAVNQPDAHNPPSSGLPAAASASKWNGWGSNRRAKAIISSSSMFTVPSSNTWPPLKSSNASSAMAGIVSPLQYGERDVVQQAVGGHPTAAVEAGHPGQVGEPAAGLGDDQLHGRQVPGVRLAVDAQVDGPFGDQHVLPEVAERPHHPAPPGEIQVPGQRAQLGPGTQLGGGQAGVGQVGDARHGDPSGGPRRMVRVGRIAGERAAARAGPPPPTQRGSADHAHGRLATLGERDQGGPDRHASGEVL